MVRRRAGGRVRDGTIHPYRRASRLSCLRGNRPLRRDLRPTRAGRSRTGRSLPDAIALEHASPARHDGWAGISARIYFISVQSRTRQVILGRKPRRTLVRIIVLSVVSFITFGWLLTPIRVRGISMEPTYQDSTVHLINRIVYRVRAPRRGDVVAIRLAGPNVLYVKRIIGLPSERVSIVDGVVEINGAPLAEPYVRDRQPWNYEEVTVGPREYSVIGANRA